MPALAGGDCGPAPLAPAIPAVSDLNGKTVEAGHKELMDAYQQVKLYQGSLTSFVSCLDQGVKSDNDELAAAKAARDDSKVAAVKQRIEDREKAYQRTMDTQTQVVSDFEALHTAPCAQDPTVCPKKK